MTTNETTRRAAHRRARAAFGRGDKGLAAAHIRIAARARLRCRCHGADVCGEGGSVPRSSGARSGTMQTMTTTVEERRGTRGSAPARYTTVHHGNETVGVLYEDQRSGTMFVRPDSSIRRLLGLRFTSDYVWNDIDSALEEIADALGV